MVLARWWRNFQQRRRLNKLASIVSTGPNLARRYSEAVDRRMLSMARPKLRTIEGVLPVLGREVLSRSETLASFDNHLIMLMGDMYFVAD